MDTKIINPTETIQTVSLTIEDWLKNKSDDGDLFKLIKGKKSGCWIMNLTRNEIYLVDEKR
jgi:hypothetical protein